MKLYCRLDYVPILSFSNFEFCEHCLYGKQIKSAYKRQEKKGLEKLDLVHSVVCDPMQTWSLSRAEYYVAFGDDASRKVWVYAIAQKNDVFNIFQKWLALV